MHLDLMFTMMFLFPLVFIVGCIAIRLVMTLWCYIDEVEYHNPLYEWFMVRVGYTQTKYGGWRKGDVDWSSFPGEMLILVSVLLALAPFAVWSMWYLWMIWVVGAAIFGSVELAKRLRRKYKMKKDVTHGNI